MQVVTPRPADRRPCERVPHACWPCHTRPAHQARYTHHTQADRARCDRALTPIARGGDAPGGADGAADGARAPGATARLVRHVQRARAPPPRAKGLSRRRCRRCRAAQAAQAEGARARARARARVGVRVSSPYPAQAEGAEAGARGERLRARRGRAARRIGGNPSPSPSPSPNPSPSPSPSPNPTPNPNPRRDPTPMPKPKQVGLISRYLEAKMRGSEVLTPEYPSTLTP